MKHDKQYYYNIAMRLPLRIIILYANVYLSIQLGSKLPPAEPGVIWISITTISLLGISAVCMCLIFGIVYRKQRFTMLHQSATTRK